MRYKKDNFKNSQNSQKKACDSILLSKTVVEQLRGYFHLILKMNESIRYLP